MEVRFRAKLNSTTRAVSGWEKFKPAELFGARKTLKMPASREINPEMSMRSTRLLDMSTKSESIDIYFLSATQKIWRRPIPFRYLSSTVTI